MNPQVGRHLLRVLAWYLQGMTKDCYLARALGARSKRLELYFTWSSLWFSYDPHLSSSVLVAVT